MIVRLMLLMIVTLIATVVVVAALVRVARQLHGGGWDDAPQGPADRRGEPAWWPEFEREFAEYVRTGAGRDS